MNQPAQAGVLYRDPVLSRRVAGLTFTALAALACGSGDDDAAPEFLGSLAS